MLCHITCFAISAPRRILILALLLMAGAGVYGAPVMDSLSAGGFRNPASESWDATQMLAHTFEQGDMNLIVSISSDAGVQSETARAVAHDLARQLKGFPFITQVHSAWTAPAEMTRSMISEDGKTGLIVAGVSGGENGAQRTGARYCPYCRTATESR